MACCGGKKIRHNKIVVVPEVNVTTDNYKEGQNGYTQILFTYDTDLRMRGCKSGHIYWFSPGREYNIDSNDAKCFLQKDYIERVASEDFSEIEVDEQESTTDFF
jgi:hypothetical protein